MRTSRDLVLAQLQGRLRRPTPDAPLDIERIGTAGPGTPAYEFMERHNRGALNFRDLNLLAQAIDVRERAETKRLDQIEHTLVDLMTLLKDRGPDEHRDSISTKTA